MGKDVEYYKDNPFEVEWDDVEQDELDEGIFDGKPAVEKRLEAANAVAKAFAGKGGELGELAKKLGEYAKRYKLCAGQAEANKDLGLKDKAAGFKLAAEAYLALLDNGLVDVAEQIKNLPEDPKTDLIADNIAKTVKWKKVELNAKQKAAFEKVDKALAQAATDKAEQEKRMAGYADKMVGDRMAADDEKANDKFAKMPAYYTGSKVKVGSGKPKDDGLKKVSDSIADHLGNMKGSFAIISSDADKAIAVALFGADANQVKSALVADLRQEGVECKASVSERTWQGYPFTHIVKLTDFRLAQQQKVAMQMAA